MESAPKPLKKPHVRLTGTDGNVFALLGLCSRALKNAGQSTRADELRTRVFNAGSYDEALNLMCEYCDVR